MCNLDEIIQDGNMRGDGVSVGLWFGREGGGLVTMQY